jgi:hypothetical protein
MNQNIGGFPHLKQNFLRISEAKIKEWIDNVFHQLNALVIKTLKYSKTV